MHDRGLTPHRETVSGFGLRTFRIGSVAVLLAALAVAGCSAVPRSGTPIQPIAAGSASSNRNHLSVTTSRPGPARPDPARPGPARPGLVGPVVSGPVRPHQNESRSWTVAPPPASSGTSHGAAKINAANSGNAANIAAEIERPDALPASAAAMGVDSLAASDTRLPTWLWSGSFDDRDLDEYWFVSTQECLTVEGPNAGCNECSNGTAFPCIKFYHRRPRTGVRSVTAAEFYSTVDPAIPVCFVVHGVYTEFRNYVAISRNINRWIRTGGGNRPLRIVFFSWPSNGVLPIPSAADFNLLGLRSSYQGVMLADVINRLPAGQPVSLMGHSLGARIAASALNLQGGGSIESGYRLDPATIAQHRYRAVLIAAAIDRDWLQPNGRFPGMMTVTERVLNLHNTSDAALAFYPLRKGFGTPALGFGQLTPRDRLALGDASQRIAELDASPFVGLAHDWGDYVPHPSLAAAFAPYLYFSDLPEVPVSGVTSGRKPVAVPDANPNFKRTSVDRRR